MRRTHRFKPTGNKRGLHSHALDAGSFERRMKFNPVRNNWIASPTARGHDPGRCRFWPMGQPCLVFLLLPPPFVALKLANDSILP